MNIRRIIAAGVGLALGSTLLTAAPASASQLLGRSCWGEQVTRCVAVYRDDGGWTSSTATVTDVAGGGNYEVAANRYQLQAWDGSKWVGWTSVHNQYDGWWDTSDFGLNPQGIQCSAGGSSFWVRARAYMTWRTAATNEVLGGAWYYSDSVWCP